MDMNNNRPLSPIRSTKKQIGLQAANLSPHDFPPQNKAMKQNTLTLYRVAGINLTWGLLIAAALLPPPADAVQFATGEVSGSIDTTLSYGTTWRVQDQDKDILGLASTTLPNGSSPPGSLGGRAFSVNGDDGNLNYDTGLVSNVLKVVSEVELNHSGGFGAFIRGRAFYDFENEDGDREKIDLTDPALDLVGSDVEFLDAYIYAQLDAAGHPFEVRVGDQVVSWGESTFIQNGINVINPVDVAAIRVPGSELREALLPEGMVWGSLGINANQSLEVFYQYDWSDTEPDPSGSYFSTNDFATDGGRRLMLQFGRVPDIIPAGPAASVNLGLAPIGAVVPRGPSDRPSDGGQGGIAYRALIPQLADTEIGLYYINYHSRLPIISARTGTLAGLAQGDYAGSARYFTEFPEDIQLFGASFNTALGTTGWALQGELSYKQDVPLQVDDVELLFAALSPLAIPEAAAGAPGTGTLFAQNNQVAPGGVGFETVIPGFIERDVVQLQLTASNVFANVLRANQLAVVGEVGVTHVRDMPSKDELRLEVNGTYTSGNPLFTAVGVQPATESRDNFADATSWGYQVRARLEYNNAIGPVTLLPALAFRHDVNGNTPGPGGNFLEDRKAFTVSLGANYQNSVTAEVSYTNFSGAGRLNLINDRDFISFNIKFLK